MNLMLPEIIDKIILEIFDIVGATLVPSTNEREEMILLS